MSKFYRLIQALIPSFPSQAERDEAYLAGAVDIYDLEHRMRDIDARTLDRCTSPMLSAGMP